jgi:hypothetical protein
MSKISRVSRWETFGLAVTLSIAASTAAEAATCVGTCGVLGANGVVTAPPNGGDYRYVVTTEDGPQGGGDIPGFVGETTSGSTYTSDSFTAAAGDKLVFYFNYVTSDGAGFADFGWSALATGSTSLTLFTARTTESGDTVPGFELPGLAPGVVLTPASTPIIGGGPAWSPLGDDSGECFDDGCGYTGWIKSEYTVANAGTYTLKFGSANWDDELYQSGLAFAGLKIGDTPIDPTPTVPEPGTLALLGLGLAGLGLSRRRRAD